MILRPGLSDLAISDFPSENYANFYSTNRKFILFPSDSSPKLFSYSPIFASHWDSSRPLGALFGKVRQRAKGTPQAKAVLYSGGVTSSDRPANVERSFENRRFAGEAAKKHQSCRIRRNSHRRQSVHRTHQWLSRTRIRRFLRNERPSPRIRRPSQERERRPSKP